MSEVNEHMKEKVLASDLQVGDVIEMYVRGWDLAWLPIKQIQASASGNTLYLLGHDRVGGKYRSPRREYRASTMVKVLRRIGD